jgi:hypothetical protein
MKTFFIYLKYNYCLTIFFFLITKFDYFQKTTLNIILFTTEK